MPAPIIKIDAISKSFGALKVLDGLSMEVMPGEKLALIGPSGSGKTTILRILMTLERIDAGHIQIEGEHLYHMERNGQLVPADERHLTKMRQKIGMVFQLFNLFPHKCVLDNVTLAPILTKGASRADAEKRVSDTIAAARADADQARKAAASLSIWLAISMFVGAFSASLAAIEGGQLRDERWKGVIGARAYREQRTL